MKSHTIASLLALAAATTVTRAGSPAPSPEIAAATEAPWIQPTLDLRLRYEYADLAAPGLDSSTALTIRERVGLLTRDFHGFAAFAEFEGTQAIHDHYDAAPGATTSPDHPFRTPINDPENAELNQAWLRYKNWDTEFKLGRQRMNLDNAAMIGNVGWRQNEQTYDGLSIKNSSLDGLTAQYAYFNRVNRIFGQDATGALRNFAGDVHLFNGSYTGIAGLTLGGYAYFMDFDETGAAFSNNTYGISAKQTFDLGGSWKSSIYGEFAYQTDASSSPFNYDAIYGHFIASAQTGDHVFSLGYEHLGAAGGSSKATGAFAGTSFKTPLATAHAFNGFSDTLVGARLAGTPGGIGDLYASYATKLPWWGLNFTAMFHVMGQDDFRFDYGWEADAVLSKKFNDHFLAIAKYALYDADGPRSGNLANPAPFDATRFSVELNYTF